MTAKLKPTRDEVKKELRLDDAVSTDDELIDSYIDAAAASICAKLNWVLPHSGGGSIVGGAIGAFLKIGDDISAPMNDALVISTARMVGRTTIEMPVRGIYINRRITPIASVGDEAPAFNYQTDIVRAGANSTGTDNSTDAFRFAIVFREKNQIVRASEQQTLDVPTAKPEKIEAHFDNRLDARGHATFLIPWNCWEQTLDRLRAAAGDNWPAGANWTDMDFWIYAQAADVPAALLQAMRRMAVDNYLTNGQSSLPMRDAVDRLLRPYANYGAGL